MFSKLLIVKLHYFCIKVIFKNQCLSKMSFISICGEIDHYHSLLIDDVLMKKYKIIFLSYMLFLFIGYRYCWNLEKWEILKD